MHNTKLESYCRGNLKVECIHKCSIWQANLKMRYKNIIQKCKIILSIFAKKDFNYNLLDLFQDQNLNCNFNVENHKIYNDFDDFQLKPLSTLPVENSRMNDNTDESQVYYLEMNLKSDDNEKYKCIREINSQFSLCNFDLLINVYSY